MLKYLASSTRACGGHASLLRAATSGWLIRDADRSRFPSLWCRGKANGLLRPVQLILKEHMLTMRCLRLPVMRTSPVLLRRRVTPSQGLMCSITPPPSNIIFPENRRIASV